MTDGSKRHASLSAHFASDMVVFDRVIAQARAGDAVTERHPETDEVIDVEIGDTAIVLSTASRPAFYRMRLRRPATEA